MPCWGADRWTFCIYQLPPVVSLLLDVTFFRCLFYECQRPHGYLQRVELFKQKLGLSPYFSFYFLSSATETRAGLSKNEHSPSV